jgi:hypothetical protein
MQFGLWMARVKITAVNEDGFHQAKPPEYHPSTLELNTPISFHKFITAHGGKNIDIEGTKDKFYIKYLVKEGGTQAKEEL